MASSETLLIQPATGGIAVAGGLVAATAANEIDYTGSVGLGSIIFAIGVVVAGAFVRHSTNAWKETAEARQATINDLHGKLVELTAENRELSGRPDMTTFMEALHSQQRVIDTLAQGSSETALQILQAIKSGTDLVIEHDKRANQNIDRLAQLIADRETRFRQTDR